RIPRRRPSVATSLSRNEETQQAKAGDQSRHSFRPARTAKETSSVARRSRPGRCGVCCCCGDSVALHVSQARCFPGLRSAPVRHSDFCQRRRSYHLPTLRALPPARTIRALWLVELRGSEEKGPVNREGDRKTIHAAVVTRARLRPVRGRTLVERG